MASVTISIPNIGNVVAENAATEETLLKLLKAMEKIGGAATSGDAKKAQDDLIKAKKDETEASKKQNKSTTDLTGEQKKAREETEKFNSQLKDTRNNFVNVVGNVGKAAISLTAQFATAYQSIANNPIGAAAGIINTGIDLVNQGTKVATGFIGMIPFVGQGLKQAADAAADLAASLAKVANDIMAAEFKKSVAQLQQYTKAGASFAGGMIEMRNVAHDAGVSMEIMSKAAQASTEEFRAMGLTQGEGVKALSNSMKTAGTVVGRSGNSLRNEMLAMGYSYEEQGAIMSQYMAQQKASGQLEKMTTEEIARGTKEYATNLKTLSDITGEDAKKLMEKARQESMRGALISKLQGDQQGAFKDAYATLSSFGPEVQAALVQKLSGGAVTDPVIAGNAKLMALINQTAEGVNAGNKDMINQTQSAMATTAKDMRAAGTSALDTAAVMSRGQATMATSMANVENRVLGYQLDPGAAEKSKKAAIDQSEATDGVTKGYQQVTEAGVKLATTMEKLASENLPAYADLLGTTMKKAIEAFEWLADKIRGGEAPLTPAQKETKQWQGEAPGTRTESGMEFGGPGLSGAVGGIFSGPTSGYRVTMHGTEAILPLGGSSSIPSKLSDLPADIAKGAGDGKSMEDIASLFGKMTSSIASATSAASGSIDTGGIIELLRSQLDKQDEMLRAMEENKNATERLMYNLT